ncbi:AraC family transcriptional regulator [Rhodococcus sp. NCIMB 12038]|uniref:AraC family transcriptional regulator n=1 Tax=Rhodococcus sp. NCIMB 12038 TaxID=933800 RepID=UPI000B3C054B|nr:AraC family transcriptional regulator [Rhodococcus sp. NCIMB 12038]OUS95654.1 AraC family transcriptional regulator [Rhodococcus sp. NCIMB 12038]
MKPLARYAALNNYVELAQSLGLNPVRSLREVGLDPASLSLQDQWAPAAAVAELLERSAATSGRDDFGFALATLRRFSNLGPLSLVIREEPDVRSALKVLMRYQHTYNESLRTRMSEDGGIAALEVSVDVGKPGELRQSIDLTVGVLYRLLRDLLGPQIQPLAVSFSHPAPRHGSTYTRLFGPIVQFGQVFDGISLYATDLDAPNAMSDPLLRPYAQKFLESIEASHQATTVNRVRELIEILLPTGRCSMERVAHSLGVDRRTLHRKLAAEGNTFSSVLDSVRAELAGRLVGNSRRSLIEIADMLSFSSPSNFSRWFKTSFGCSPTVWRTSVVGDRRDNR